ncbi:MAG: peptide chain release factor N(5)-glutamine methyltransferase, partial [Acidimicrobiales bacterium]
SGICGRIQLLEGDFYEALPASSRGRVDLVVANPPYVSKAEWPLLDPVVRDYDPYSALVAGPSGLEAIEAVISGLPAVLASPGGLVVEIAPHQAAAAAGLAAGAGLSRVEVRVDLAGRPRVLVAWAES